MSLGAGNMDAAAFAISHPYQPGSNLLLIFLATHQRSAWALLAQAIVVLLHVQTARPCAFIRPHALGVLVLLLPALPQFGVPVFLAGFGGNS